MQIAKNVSYWADRVITQITYKVRLLIQITEKFLELQ